MNRKKIFEADYDVIVVGFGGAGATAARFAADRGAKVLIVDAAPLGHEGGNTRYCAQDAGYSTNYEKTLDYYHQLTYPIKQDENVLKSFVKGLVEMPEYYRKFLGVEPIETSDVPQFPEFSGHEAYHQQDVHHGNFDAALWKLLRQKVLDRSHKIDIWLNSPAVHLIQDPDRKTIKGVQIKRNNKLINVLARKGVILSSGGFENNQEMKQAFLGTANLKPVGTIYNRGDGLRMAQEIGAKLWHMWNFETLGILHGISFADKSDKRAPLFFNWPELHTGSILMIAGDGSRYFREDEENRHGHLYSHGTWVIPRMPENPYLVFDQKQYDELHQHNIPYKKFDQHLIQANSIEELANKISVKAKILKQTITDFNSFAECHKDYQYNRAPKTMKAFSDGPYYAIKMAYDILNTQGGPARNGKAQIIDVNGKPIPHLFGAGELGGICSNLYQGGANVAECLIFGRIAGENVVKAVDPLMDNANKTYNNINDILMAEKNIDISVNPDQYIGSSTAGIGGKMIVRVTYKDHQIKNIEVLENHESEDVGLKALKIMPQEMVANNSIDVDAVSGASATSRALKSAVKDALNQAENRG